MAKQFKYDETKLKAKQREAAVAMVEYEFTPKEDRKTQEQIAEEVGITRRTLHNWNYYDDNFINYKNHLSAQMMDTHLSFVYSKTLDAISNGSVRAMEMFFKRIGDLDTKSEVTINDGSQQSFEERKAELLKRLGGETNDEN